MLRLREGEVVVAADGAGRWAPGRWAAGRVVVDGEVVVDAPPAVPVAVGLVPTKGDRPEWAVQKLTELGVDRIAIATSARSVVRWEGDRADRHLSRLVEVARQAGMQSRRPRLPVVEGPVPVGALVAEGGWALAEPGGGPLLPGVGVVVGPEGGWDPGELGLGAPTVDLGPTVLRAETAAVAVGALLSSLRVGVVGPVPLRGSSGPAGWIG